MIFVFWAIMGLIVAWIASNKGYSFVGWFIYGILLWPIALIHIAFVSNKGKKCPKCFSKIDIRASVCPFCKYEITSEEIKANNEAIHKHQRGKYVILAVFGGIIFLVIVLANSIRNSALNKVQEAENVTSTNQPTKQIPYSVQSSGSLSYIILGPEYANVNDLTILGQELRGYYKGAGFVRVSIYDDKKAVTIRDRVTNEQATQSETSFYDSHYIGQYNKNDATNYNEFVIYPMGETKKIEY